MDESPPAGTNLSLPMVLHILSLGTMPLPLTANLLLFTVVLLLDVFTGVLGH